MKAVGLYKYLPIEDSQSLVDLDVQQPEHPTGHDLLVAIKAISVNPLDTKVRRGTISPTENENVPRILGWDAAGEVIAVGSDCTLFEIRDAVYYAGSISRPGTNCEFHLVDERIVGRKRKSLSFEEAAAMPLTTITAWEALYDRLCLYSDTIRRKTALPAISTSNDSDIVHHLFLL
jgi:NADPH:quinone reductase